MAQIDQQFSEKSKRDFLSSLNARAPPSARSKIQKNGLRHFPQCRAFGGLTRRHKGCRASARDDRHRAYGSCGAGGRSGDGGRGGAGKGCGQEEEVASRDWRAPCVAGRVETGVTCVERHGIRRTDTRAAFRDGKRPCDAPRLDLTLDLTAVRRTPAPPPSHVIEVTSGQHASCLVLVGRCRIDPAYYPPPVYALTEIRYSDQESSIRSRLFCVTLMT